MRVKKATGKIYGIWILLVEAVGALSGWLTREGSKIYTATVEKPSLSPPGAVFPVVWGILFALMGIGAARIYMALPSPERTKSLRLFFIQLAFNFFWSILFFNFQQFGLAALWLAGLWGAILWMIAAFWPIEKTAAWLQFPYLVWVSFAGYLNVGVWLLN